MWVSIERPQSVLPTPPTLSLPNLKILDIRLHSNDNSYDRYQLQQLLPEQLLLLLNTPKLRVLSCEALSNVTNVKIAK